MMSELDRNEFVPIPLPYQIPEPPDLSKLPIGVIHSATVETLISQTEDLSARLKVQIRRNAVLERKALEMEEKTQIAEKELSSLKGQHEIFNEKETAQAAKIRELQNAIDSEKKELQLLETRYTELFSLGQKKESDAQKKIADLNEKNSELERLLPLEAENFQFRDEIVFLKNKVEELVNYLQRKEDESTSLRTQLNEKNEQVANFEGQIKQLKDQVEYGIKSVEEKAELENLLILKEREKEHTLSQMSNELMILRQEYKNMQMALKTGQTEKNNVDTQLRSCEETIAGLSRDNSELERQIENLQNLWYKLQAEYEKEKTKNVAMNKLNRELSVELQRTQTTSSFEEEYLKTYIQKNRNAEV
jgi:chromosome segregation ATPase